MPILYEVGVFILWNPNTISGTTVNRIGRPFWFMLRWNAYRPHCRISSRRANHKYGFVYTHREPRDWPDGNRDMLYYTQDL